MCHIKSDDLAYRISGTILLAAVFITMISYRKTSREGASNSAIMALSVGVADVITDCMVLLGLYFEKARTYFTIFLAAQVFSFLANGIILYYVFSKEMTSNIHFREWNVNHTSIFRVLLMLACFDMQAISLISSKVFNITSTDAPLSYEARYKLSIFSSVSLFLENMPQLVLQILVLARPENGLFLMQNLPLAIALSSFEMLSAVFVLVLSGQRSAPKQVLDNVAKEYRNSKRSVEDSTLLGNYGEYRAPSFKKEQESISMKILRTSVGRL